MSPPAAEIDFLGIRPQHRDHHFHLPPCPSPLEIPKTAWNISPDLLRSGVGTPRPWPVPFLDPSSRSTVEGLRGPTDASGSPLTIFYNGTVAVFNVPRDMAEAIMTLAERESTAAAEGPRARARAEELVRGGLQFSYLPLARQRSLQRFLEKRRERISVGEEVDSPLHSNLRGDRGLKTRTSISSIKVISTYHSTVNILVDSRGSVHSSKCALIHRLGR